MGPAIERALKLQHLDRRIIELKREIAALPRHIDEIENQLVSHHRRLEADQTALRGNEKQRRGLESEIQRFEEKISKLKNQMLDAKTNEQYRAFQKEIEFGEEGIRKAEDQILELMEAAEPLDDAVRNAEAALQVERRVVDQEKEQARSRIAAVEAELAETFAGRKQAAAELGQKILASYERIRKRYGFPVLAEVIGDRCSACNIALRPRYFQELRQASEPMICESCGRLIYYHAPIDVEAEQSSA